jgi:hypothetical protein
MALNIGKAFINTRRVNSDKFGYDAHFMSFGLSLLPEMGQRARITISETL